MKLLAILVGAKSTPACLDAARTAAHSLPHAEIAALHVVVDPETMIAASEEIELQRLRAGKEGSARQRADASDIAEQVLEEAVFAAQRRRLVVDRIDLRDALESRLLDSRDIAGLVEVDV